MTRTMTMAGTAMKAGTTRPMSKDTWTPITGEGGTTTTEEGLVVGAKIEAPPAQIDPGGRVAGVGPGTPVVTSSGTTAEDVAPGTVTARKTSTSAGKEEEEEEGGIGAETD